jgi:hypothetical protein
MMNMSSCITLLLSPTGLYCDSLNLNLPKILSKGAVFSLLFKKYSVNKFRIIFIPDAFAIRATALTGAGGSVWTWTSAKTFQSAGTGNAGTHPEASSASARPGWSSTSSPTNVKMKMNAKSCQVGVFRTLKTLF